MTKIDTLACVIVFAMIMIFIFAFYHQMNLEKQKILCNGELRELGSAFFIYRSENVSKNVQEELWREILAPLATTQIGFCPIINRSNTFSYKLYQGSFSKDFDKKKSILFFDAVENEKATSTDIKLDLAKRHLSGANILWSDGSVQYVGQKEIMSQTIENE